MAIARDGSFALVPVVASAEALYMRNPSTLVVFTDLDGTLLDHDTYRWDAAQPTLDRLAKLEVPVILASSKTASEIRAIQDRMGLSGAPAIVENGAGVIGLGDDEGSETYAGLRAALNRLPKELRQPFRGFGDMATETVASLTGLPEADAKRAKNRSYSEPGLWSGDDPTLHRFKDHLAEHGITAQRGGRFLTLSCGRTKADAMDQISRSLEARVTLALGDAPNDVDMLETADHGVIIANPHKPALPPLAGEVEGRITRTAEAGPVGWNSAVNDFLDTFFPAQGYPIHG